VEKLFNALCAELNISADSTVMDLGCGTGEVANILAAFAGKIYAVDGSAEMLKLAEPKDNIEYQVVDLNSSNPVTDKKVDHLFFGRSIHWFPAETLRRLSTAQLKEHGKVVVCSTQWSPVGPWGEIYFEVLQKYLSPNVTPTVKHDFSGQSNLGEAGFVPAKKLVAKAKLEIDAQFMVHHAMSTTYGENLARLRTLFPDFQSELMSRLKEFDQRKEIVWEVSSWAIIYGN
jgi:ubiquinone/menaquinone biosynthesis C-methylase UbiE